MSRQLITALVGACVLWLGTSSVQAMLIAEDSFTYTDGSLSGKSGGTGAWTSAWSGPLNVSNGNSIAAGFLDVAGNQVVSQPTGSGNEVSTFYRRQWTTTGVSELWFRIDVTTPTPNVGEVNLAGGFTGGITVGTTGRPFANTNASVYNQDYPTQQPNHLRGDIRPGGSFTTPVRADALVSYDTTHTFVGRIHSPNATQTTLTVWLDPTSTGDAPLFSGTHNAVWTSYNTGFLSIYHESHNVTSMTFDNVRLGTTFEDVLPPIPEPATASVVGALGAAVMLTRRRGRG